MSQHFPLNEQIKALEQVQELDLKIDLLKKRKDSLPGTLKTAADTLAQLRSKLEAKEKAVFELEKTQRQTQAALDLNQDRAKRSTSKIDNVSNMHEYQAASKEMDQLKKMNGSLEEQLTKNKSEVTVIQTETSALSEQIEALKSGYESDSQKMNEERENLDSELSQLGTQRKEYTPHVEPRVLTQYDRIRGARAGLGIVPAIGGRCKGCNIVLPPQLFNEVQKTLVMQFCPSCHRILFAPGQPSEPNTDSGVSSLA